MAFFKTIFKRLLISLLTVSMLSSTLIMPIVQLDFELRKEYIYATFCIKKDEPITVCGGNCYLNNRLKGVLEQQEKETETTIRISSIVFFKQEIQSPALKRPVMADQDNNYARLSCGKIVRFNASIFRPPQSA